MPPDTILDDQEYGSSDDSDFAPDVAPTQASDDSSDEESEPAEVKVKKAKPRSTKRKRGQDDEAEDAGFENSGDEAIIEKGLKKQRKSKNKEVDDDEGGDGVLIKTRSMRALECALPSPR
jgi:hypothetical protein